MKAIDKMVEYLGKEYIARRKAYFNSLRIEDSNLMTLTEIYSEKARSLAAEEAANEAKPKEDKGLVGELRAWLSIRPEINHMAHLRKEFEEILSRHPAPADKEPLAVLADRKGYWRVEYQEYPSRRLIHIYSRIGNNHECFESYTYEAAEAKARAWLEAQEDK